MEKFFIEKLFYVKAQEHNEVYNKPYTINVTGDDVRTLCDIMRYNNKSNLDTSVLTQSGINPVTYSSVSQPTAIDKSWVSVERYIFVLKVSYIDQIGNKQNIYIQGYTNYNGISRSGAIDPRMTHEINSVIETTEYVLNTPMYGVVHEEKIRYIQTVISNFRSPIETIFTQRPSDLFSNVGVMNLASFSTHSNDLSHFNIENKECAIHNMEMRSISSNIENNIASRYVCNALNAGLNSITEAELSFVDNFHNPIVDTSSFARENNLLRNDFVRDINRKEGTHAGTPFFMFATLLSYDPTIEQRANVIEPVSQYNPILANTPTVGEYWYGQDMVTIKAYAFIEQLTAMIMRYGLTKMYFDFSYMGQYEGPQVVVYDFNTYIQHPTENDITRLVNLVTENIKREVIVPESMNGMLHMSANCFIDIFNTSKIYLAIDGFPPNWFTIPSFAGSLFSPVVTVDKNSFDTLSSSIYSMSDVIVNTLMHS